ncbi:DNA-processing protein DprA [Achromobacter xylosoxidans]|uniref:DNA-processing protein DprA n=1 Tax=Alcaligenes xylosoxydans xylosoxydans TaxID=85698 RepID=UPI0006C280B1|nr:DNA-processing protein DprA [Achromobacter xylosoxidans]MDH0519591.1 DNA-processing protein DprA [Achromobacter xylosoxidans]MDH0543587.1 DNA-processing protein DprA [Achromobacter xylosoxidans]CUJ22536.1 DNA protecting protein DprA [Achromobacter xylosoxidans]
MPLTHTAAELSAWLRLSLEPGIGSATACTLLGALGLPEQIYAQRATALARQLPDALARQLAAPMPADMAAQVDSALQWVDAPGHHILTLSDPGYPQSLLTIADPPILLYVNGDPAYLQGPALAVVGARNATPGGQENARAFARHLAGSGWRVVSGLALGIDAAAHEGALDAGSGGAGTVAVMGTGIDRIYPARHRDLAHRIAAQGALVSELPLGTGALPQHFPKRNRIVAGLARGVLVVEAARQSGSLITARLAGESGREVFAIPGSIHSPLSRGCHALIRQGAKLVETAADITDELGGGPQPGTRRPPEPADDPGDADNPAHPVLEALGFDPLHLDALQARCGLDTATLQAQLLELELAARVARLDDGRFQRLK